MKGVQPLFLIKSTEPENIENWGKLKKLYLNDEALKDTIQKLKSQVRRLKKEVKEQNEIIKSLRKTFNKDIDHIKDLTDNLSVEEVINITNGKALSSEDERREECRRKFAKEFGSKKR